MRGRAVSRAAHLGKVLAKVLTAAMMRPDVKTLTRKNKVAFDMGAL
jgi:hypothetical protein